MSLGDAMSCNVGNGIGDEAKPSKWQYANLSRRDVRSLAFHFLYAIDAFEYDRSLESIVDMFNRGFKLDVPLDSEVVSIAQGVIDSQEELDRIIKPFLLNWRFDRIGLGTKLLLRMALWEFKQPKAIPNIIINEAIELAKCFTEKDAYKFINGILDGAAKQLSKLQN